ncbi:MAG: hypothetical protein L0Z50_06400, partial [Verrucomicrobiales bacterium]|nr:hypothetical protein [Verrucomicrobiales bacterium]
MKNPIPSAIHERFSFSENLADGLHKHEASIGMMHNPEALLRVELEAGRTSDNVYQTAKAAALAASIAQRIADENGRVFIMKARD